MTAFAAAVNVLFGDANLARDAMYIAGGEGSGTSIRVIRTAPDEEARFNAGRFVTATVLLDVRLSDVPVLEEGDHIVIGDTTYEIHGDPYRDSERLVWRATGREVV